MLLKRVTFTGIDSKTDLKRAIELALSCPFSVEYGVLVSETGAGLKPRYPEIELVKDIFTAFKNAGIPTALHVCGSWSRKLLKGEDDLFQVLPASLGYQRLQWNINPPGKNPVQRAKWNVEGAAGVFQSQFFWKARAAQLIVQRHSENSVLLYAELERQGVPMAVLFDSSGGRGVVNDSWPAPQGDYCGYAGGFSPENVRERVKAMSEALPEGQEVWIDMESGVRGEGDYLDLDKVAAVLKHLTSLRAMTVY